MSNISPPRATDEGRTHFLGFENLTNIPKQAGIGETGKPAHVPCYKMGAWMPNILAISVTTDLQNRGKSSQSVLQMNFIIQVKHTEIIWMLILYGTYFLYKHILHQRILVSLHENILFLKMVWSYSFKKNKLWQNKCNSTTFSGQLMFA